MVRVCYPGKADVMLRHHHPRDAAFAALIRAGLMAALPLDSGLSGANTGKQSRRNQAVSHD